MVTVGVLVRAEVGRLDEVASRLAGLTGVRTFPLEEPGTLGVVIQEADLDRAHAKLCEEIRAVSGVLAAWPVHTELAPTPAPSLTLEPE